MTEKCELSTPIQVNGIQVSVLNVREPTVGDQIDASKLKGSEAENEVAMLAALCDVSPEDLRMLTLRDYKNLQEVVENFISSTDPE